MFVWSEVVLSDSHGEIFPELKEINAANRKCGKR